MVDDQDIISAYNRACALADGVLVDASAQAAEAGLRYPVALTHAAWDACVAAPAGPEAHAEADRLWDVLQALIVAIRRGAAGPLVAFSLQARSGGQLFGGQPVGHGRVALRASCGAGDDGWPCITIMKTEED